MVTAAPEKPRAAAKKKAAAPKKKAAPAKKKAAAPPPASSPPRSRWKRQARRLFLGGVIAASAFFALTFLWALTYRFVNPPCTALMLTRHYFEKMPIEKEWRDFDAISPKLAVAILAAEDQRFPEHAGIDFTEMRNALDRGGRLRGASTISQQTAKNVFLWNARSWLRKGLEAYFTGLIEVLWGKQRILEVYMNVAEMGPGIYGAEAAARHYFHKAALDLTGKEAAAIAAILPNPRTRTIEDPAPEVARKRQWILQQMNNLGGTAYLKKIAGNGNTP